jgi:hypothetical protein
MENMLRNTLRTSGTYWEPDGNPLRTKKKEIVRTHWEPGEMKN